jgi:hypothetical protein
MHSNPVGAVMDNGGDNNGAIIEGVVGGNVPLVLAMVALLITRRRTNPSVNLQSAGTFDDPSSENMEQPIAE